MLTGIANSATLNTRPDDEYHADYSRLSASMLKKFKKSRREYHALYVEKTKKHEPTKPEMDIGSAIHALFLKQPIEIITFPSECFTAGGKFKKYARENYKQEHPGKICLTAKEYEHVEGAVSALKKNNAASDVLDFAEQSGYIEQEINWVNVHNQHCRCKLDMAGETETCGFIYDLKCTSMVAPDDFHRHVKQMRAWIQQVHYSTGFALLTGKPVNFYFVVVNPEPPHQVQITSLEDTSSAVARNEYNTLLVELSRCHRDNDWHEPWEKMSNEISLKDWDYE